MKILLIGVLILLVAVAKDAKAAPVTDGLILHLDAAAQIKEGGVGASNNVWRNLAGQPDAIAGSGALHNFAGDSVSGWVGSGTAGEPYALRFDGKTTYVVGPGNLEIPEITIEAWARVDGVGGQTAARRDTDRERLRHGRNLAHGRANERVASRCCTR